MKKQYLLVSALTGALLAPLAVEQGIVPFADTTTNVQAVEATGEDVSDRVTIEQIDAEHYRISGNGDVKAGDYILLN